VVSRAAVNFVNPLPALDRVVPAEPSNDVLVIAASETVGAVRADELEGEGWKKSARLDENVVGRSGERNELIEPGGADAHPVREIRPEHNHVEPGRVGEHVL